MSAATEIPAGAAAAGRRPPSLAASSAIVSLCTAGSRVLGYARDSALGALLGSSPAYSALRLAFNVPNFLRRLLGEGALAAVFLPLFQEAERNGGEPRARSLVSVVAGAQGLVLLALAALGVAACLLCPTPTAATLLHVDEEKAGLLLKYLSILLPYLIPVCLYAFAASVLNARHRFLAPAAAPVLQNIVALAGCALAWLLVVGSADPTTISAAQQDRAATLIAAGFLTAGFCMFVMQLPALRREGLLVAPKFTVRSPDFILFLRRLTPVLLGMGVVQVSVLLSSIVAFSILPDGGNIHLDYAARIFQLPQGLIGTAVATAAFPTISRAWAEGDRVGVVSELERALVLALAAAAPACAGLLALALPITTLLYGYGAFTSEACAASADALIVLAPAIPFVALTPLLARAFYAAGRTTLPTVVAAALVVLDLSLAVGLGLQFGLPGVAAATTVTAVANCLLLAVLLRKLGLPRGLHWARPVAKVAFCASICGLAAFGGRLAAQHLLGISPDRRFALALAQTVLGIGGGAASYALAIHATHLFTWQQLRTELDRLRRRRSKRSE